MARKTYIPTVEPATRGHYADYPGCLPNYKWLVELALKNPEVMFNVPTSHGPSYCKACGAAYHRKQFVAHVNEHATQLKLNTYGGVPKVVEALVENDPDELTMTILMSLQDKLPDLELAWSVEETDTADALVFDIALETEESEIGDAPLCGDCQ